VIIPQKVIILPKMITVKVIISPNEHLPRQAEMELKLIKIMWLMR